MKLNTARQMWHDATATNCRSSFGALMEIERLGVHVQTTARCFADEIIVRGVLAGHVLAAIEKLPADLRAFGSAMYSAHPSDDDRELAEELVLSLAYRASCVKMREAKYEKARYVAAAAFYQYRVRHQGGQSEGPDVLPSPAAFRAHVLEVYGVRLSAEQWGRNWGDFIRHCKVVCDQLDGLALSPIGALKSRLKDSA